MTPVPTLTRRQLAVLLGAACAGFGAQAEPAPKPAAPGAPSTPGAPAPLFPPTMKLGGVDLQLNGYGLRTKFGFKVYDLGLYTEAKVSSVDELLALRGPKYLSFIARRDLPGTELGRLFFKGMAQNASEAVMSKHASSVSRLIEVFSVRATLASGDTFAMEYLPGKGTTFYIGGVSQGAAVGDAEFFGVILGVWMGPHPADDRLKARLLGGEAN